MSFGCSTNTGSIPSTIASRTFTISRAYGARCHPQMPAGTWSAVDYCDDNGIDRGVPVKVGSRSRSTPRLPKSPSTSPIRRAAARPDERPDHHRRFPVPGDGQDPDRSGIGRLRGFLPADQGHSAQGTIFNAHDAAPTNLYGWPGLTAVRNDPEGHGSRFSAPFPGCIPGRPLRCLSGTDSTRRPARCGSRPTRGIGQGATRSPMARARWVHIDEACSRNLPVELEETKDRRSSSATS